MTHLYFRLIVILAVAVATGCSSDSPETRPRGAQLSSSDVLKIAKDYLGSMRKFKQPTTEYNPVDRSWFVYYDRNDGIEDAGLYVDDVTGKISSKRHYSK